MSELTEKPAAPNHRVTVSQGFTMNTGDFNSVRHDVTLSIDGKPGDTPDDTYRKVSAWVEKRIEEVFIEARNELDGK